MANKVAPGNSASKKSKKSADLETPSRIEADASGLFPGPLPAPFGEVDIPPDVREFCALKQVEDEVRTTISLARDHFAMVGEPEFEVVDDPECGEHYVAIHVRVAGEPEEVFRQSEAFLDSFLASVDTKKRRYINLIYR
jgi:hypothetical protein